MIIKTYLMKFMLQQSESRVFGFLGLICFCICGCCFFLLDVLLPLLLLLLLLFWWWLLVVPFLVDLFGAIALLDFLLLARSFSRWNNFSFRFVVVCARCTSHCGKTRFLIRNVTNHAISVQFHFYFHSLATKLIAFGFCQHWTLIIAVSRLLVARFVHTRTRVNTESTQKTFWRTSFSLPLRQTRKKLLSWLSAVTHWMIRQ